MELDVFNDKAEAIRYIRENVPDCRTALAAEIYLAQHLPKESYYQEKIIKYIQKEYGEDAVVWKEAAGPYSQQGIPDVTVVLNGRYYGFEVKRPYIGILSKIQEQTIKRIRRAGGIAEVVSFPKDVAAVIDRSNRGGFDYDRATRSENEEHFLQPDSGKQT